MPVPEDVCKVTLRARLGGTQVEEAQFGFNMQREHFTGNTVDWAADVGTIAEKVRDSFVENFVTQTFWSSSVQMDAVEVFHLDTQGHTLDKGVAVFEGPQEWVGDGSESLPWETSAVVSLYAYNPAGFAQDRRNKRGRFYLPPLVTSFMDGAKGRYQGGGSFAIQPLHIQVNSWLNDVNGLELGPGSVGRDNMRLVVLSRVKSACYRVTYSRMDTAPDVQRRRQRSMPVDYYSAPVNQS